MNAKKLFLIFLSMMGLSATGAVAGGGYVEYGPSGQTPTLVLVDSATPAQPNDCWVYAGAYYHGIGRQTWTVDKTNMTSYIKTTVPFTYYFAAALPGNTINCTTTISTVSYTTNTSNSKVGTASGRYSCRGNDYLNNAIMITGVTTQQFDFNRKVGFNVVTEITDPVTVNGVVHQCTQVFRTVTMPIQNGF